MILGYNHFTSGSPNSNTDCFVKNSKINNFPMFILFRSQTALVGLFFAELETSFQLALLLTRSLT